jgi:predicted RNA-binding Zn-ribbon protein involved in translation (DUF1610 family)
MLHSWVTRAIQRRHGYKPVPFVCPECGLRRPPLESFPSSNVIGITALAWAASGHRVWSTGISCPRCGNPMTVEEELARRERQRKPGHEEKRT